MALFNDGYLHRGLCRIPQVYTMQPIKSTSSILLLALPSVLAYCHGAGPNGYSIDILGISPYDSLWLSGWDDICEIVRADVEVKPEESIHYDVPIKEHYAAISRLEILHIPNELDDIDKLSDTGSINTDFAYVGSHYSTQSGKDRP